MFRLIKVKIVDCDNGSGWYKDYIGEWFDVKEFKDRSILCYHVVNSQHNNNIYQLASRGIIMKTDAYTEKELREQKLKRIVNG